MAPTNAQKEADEKSQLKNLFGMQQLAISKTFEHSVGREYYDDPAAVQKLLDELLAIRTRQLSLLQAIIAKREAAELIAYGDKNAKIQKNKTPENLVDRLILNLNGESLLGGSASMDAEQELLFAQEGAVLYELANASGVARMLTDPESIKKLTQSCGLQLSQEQLALGDTLDNLERGYSIRPIQENGDNKGFVVSGLNPDLAAPALRRLLTGEKVFSMRESIFGSDGTETFDFHRKTLVNLLALPLGLNNGLREPTRRSLVNPVERNLFSPPAEWSKREMATLIALRSELDELARQARNGNFISDLLTISDTIDDSRGFGGFTPTATKYFEKLRSALGKPVQNISNEIKSIAAHDRQLRAMSWFDDIAGHRATELVAKLWGSYAARANDFSEIEMVAANAQNIWKSLEGQEALGLFSVRVAAALGLSLSGRDLPERTKAKLKSSHGFTDGAWRLLGRLSADSQSTACDWAIYLGGALTPSAEISSTQADLALDAEPLKRQLNENSKPQEAFQILGVALSAASARGAGIEQTEELLEKLFKDKEKFAELLATSSEILELDGIPLADQQAEMDAFYAKAPTLLTSMFNKALAEGCDRAWPAIELVNDWLSNAEWGIWRELPDNISWTEANRRQKEWHDMIQRSERSGKESVAWDSLVGPDANPQTGFSSIPLTDGGMLWDEGKAMRHCVSTYADKCQNGESRVFGILKDGERFATLELALDGDGEWSSVQLKGRFNKIIDDERAIEFTRQVCDAYQAAHVATIAARAAQDPKIDNLASKLAGIRKDPAGSAAGAPLPRAPE